MITSVVQEYDPRGTPGTGSPGRRTPAAKPARTAQLAPRPTAADMEGRLVRQAQLGSQVAFTAILSTYQERILRYITNMVGNMEDAHDLCQETFVRAYRALDRFNPRLPLAPWLYRIAHNVVIDYGRTRKAKPALSGSDPEYPIEDREDRSAVDPLDAAVLQEIRRAVRAVVQSLPENYRSVVALRYLDDLSYEEIAAALGITKANVMMRMTRARRMLSDRLGHLRSH